MYLCLYSFSNFRIDIFWIACYDNHGDRKGHHAPFISLSPQSYFWRSFARKSALFLRKSRSCAPFQHKLCWARELRSNTPCPGSTFSCTDCLVHTNRAGGSPLTDGGFFAEPQRGVALCGARESAAPAAGAKRKGHLRFPFLFGLLPFPCQLVWRRLPTCDRCEIGERQRIFSLLRTNYLRSPSS